MSSSSTLSWYEPYWSYHRRKHNVQVPWMILVSPRNFLRMSIAAVIAFVLGSLVLYIIFPTIYPQIISYCAIACVIYMAFIPLICFVFKWIFLTCCWLTQPLVQLNSEEFVYKIPLEDSLQLSMDNILSLVVDTRNPRRQNLTITWQGGVRTIGIPNDLDLTLVKELTGEKYQQL